MARPGHGVFELDEHLIIYSGVDVAELNCRRSGVAIVLAGSAVSAWKAAGSKFTPISDRLLVVRIKCVVGCLSVVAVYAPTNVQEEESSCFYLALQESLNKVSKRDMLIVMGDFNARVGTNANVWKGVTIGLDRSWFQYTKKARNCYVIITEGFLC